MRYRAVSNSLVLILQLLALAPDATARVLDGVLARDETLQEITEFLDQKGIDVRNRAAQLPLADAMRPQVTELASFPADPAIGGTDPFSYAFNKGLTSERAYLVAVNISGAPEPVDLSHFKDTWDQAPQSKRIFVSFSGKDLAVARVLEEGLRKAGYVVFLYKNSEAGLPPVNIVETAQFFRGAGKHFVIDTVNARSSAAVNAEALALRSPGRRAAPLIFQGTQPPPLVSPQCCQVCYYRNGMKIRCDAPVCDTTICANARDDPSSPLPPFSTSRDTLAPLLRR